MRTIHAIAVLAAGMWAAAALAQGGARPPVPVGKPQGSALRPMTREEQVKGAQQVVARGAQISRRVGAHLGEARKDGDIIRLTCLNDKLTQVNANLRNAQKRTKVLVETGDGERRRHEYTVVVVIGRRLGVLEQESNQCIGQEMYETGTTRVTTEIDPSKIPPEDPSMVPIVAPPSLPSFPPAVLIGMPEPATGQM
jgi:hypothetical protein